MDQTYPDATFLGSNSHFNEFYVWYPTTDSNSVCTDYVKYHYLDGEWDYGVDPSFERSAWMDQSAITNPVGADYAGLLQQSEAAPDLDGVPMDSWAQSGWLGLPNGSQYTHVQRVLPDFKLSDGAAMQITVSLVDYVSDTPRTYGPYALTAATPYFTVEQRGRYMSLKIESVDRGSFWRLGQIELEVQAAGAR